MKEYLKSQPAEGVSMAIIEEENEHQEKGHYVYLLNERAETLKGCLVVSRGYGQNLDTQEKIETSTLRHYVEELSGNSYVKIEPIMPEVFGLNNEYWVSFWIEDVMYDKRYIFLPESIREENETRIPLMQTKGILIQ